MFSLVQYWLVRAAVFSMEHTPLPVARQLANGYARLLDLAVPKLRRAGYRNLEIARLPGDKKRVIDGVFGSIARILLSVSRFPGIGRENVGEWIRYEGFEYFEEAKQRGRGVLFATAHLGNWELSAFAHALMAGPMNVVVRPLDNSRVDGFVERRRRMSGNRVIGKKDAARSILRALRNNEAVGILVDQNVAPGEGVFIDFFGVKACAGSAFVKLAHHSGAGVIPGFALWSDEEQRFILKFYPPMPVTGDAAVDTQRLHTTLEHVIREHPDQWLWIHRRWKTRPPVEPTLY